MERIRIDLKTNFEKKFGRQPDQVYFAPGRVNLIGEHIDYNGGRVMPAAIKQGTYLAISKNRDKQLRFYSMNFPEHAELHLQESYGKTGKQWFNYPLGVINTLLKEGHNISGLDMLFYGDLPIGAGLSSSASLEVVTMFALADQFSLNINKTDLAILSRKVENEFIGVNCGIMDQFAVAYGKKDNAILLDCDSLKFEYIPAITGIYQLVVINTNKARTLADSKYNERFTECAEVLTMLKKELQVENLCDVSVEQFEIHRHLIADEILAKRAEHVVKENERVKRASEALKHGDIKVFGELMYESHRSLKELYEVSGEELDTIVEFCQRFNGVAGARMTGAGFGGCAIALVREDVLKKFERDIISFYSERIGYVPGVFVSEIGDGVRTLE